MKMPGSVGWLVMLSRLEGPIDFLPEINAAAFPVHTSSCRMKY